MSQSKITPHVFISAASGDLRSAREVVKNALLTIGCHPIVQEHFEPDYRTVREMIRGRIAGCHAVIHLIGKCYGGEPSVDSLPEGESRRSWTQMEFQIAKELGLKTYLFICDDSYPFDIQANPDPEDELQLQEAYRQRIRTGSQLYVEVRTPQELSQRISEMKLEAAELRKLVEAAQNQLVDVLDATNQQTSQLNEGQEKILSRVEEISNSFSALAEMGGIVAEPSTPEQFYHNARLFELKGDYGNARRSYLQYFGHDLDVLDPHLRFQDFLKVQEGREGARETYQHLTKNSQSLVPKLASILLWNREQRVARFASFLKDNPDFGPAFYLCSLDFSVDRLGSQSLEDQRKERQLLERFQALDQQGNVVRWMIDQGLVSEWRSDVEGRLAALETTSFAMGNPVDVIWMSHNSGWSGTIQIAEVATEILWKKPGDDDFVSTGFSATRNYSTGQAQPQTVIDLPRGTPRSTVEIKYRNKNGESMGPFQVAFNPLEESLFQSKQILSISKSSWISMRDYNGKRLAYFTHLLCHRGSLASIRYGIDVDYPNMELTFPVHDHPGLAPIDSDTNVYMEIPGGAQFLTVQITYKDGEISTVERFPCTPV